MQEFNLSNIPPLESSKNFPPNKDSTQDTTNTPVEAGEGASNLSKITNLLQKEGLNPEQIKQMLTALESLHKAEGEAEIAMTETAELLDDPILLKTTRYLATSLLERVKASLNEKTIGSLTRIISEKAANVATRSAKKFVNKIMQRKTFVGATFIANTIDTHMHTATAIVTAFLISELLDVTIDKVKDKYGDTLKYKSIKHANIIKQNIRQALADLRKDMFPSDEVLFDSSDKTSITTL